MLPSGGEFRDLARKIYAFILPSCSESISTAGATCLQVGFYPIVSRQTGLDLPAGRGLYLEACTTEAIERAVRTTHSRAAAALGEDIAHIQRDACERYSRQAFSASMQLYFSSVLPP
jgi:hypothetical protein